MSDTHTDASADQPRIVLYPHPSGDPTREDAPVVQFPSPSEMSEEDFARATNEAWPQLLQEFVGNNYGPHEEHGYIDTMVKHILEGKSDQAKQRAQAWQAVRGHK